jgi:hypothetical protein
VKPTQVQAMQKFKQKLYAKALQLFEDVLNTFNQLNLSKQHEEYKNTLKSIQLCRSKVK